MQEILDSLLSPFLISLIVSVGVGLIIGFEREFDQLSGNETFAGLRSFVLMALLGCIITFIANTLHTHILTISIPSIFIFISVFHYSKAKKENHSVITEFSLLLVYFLGVLSGLQLIKEALAVAVITSTFLAFKKSFKATIKQITQEELYAFLRFAILSFLILPYLPNENFGPAKLINPQNIGYVIVIVSSLSFVGYFVIKFFGAQKGILFTAFFGGTFSSTAVAWIFSSKSKEDPSLSIPFAAGILIACAVMFSRVSIVSSMFNIEVFKWLSFPCGMMVLSCILGAYYILKSNKQNSETLNETIQLGNPLDLMNAAMFGIQYIAITFIVYYANIYFGTKGLFISGIISGLADVDAINISASKLSLTEITPAMASIVVLLAVISNTLFKIWECVFKGTKELYTKVSIAMAPSLLIAILSIFVIYLYA